MVKSKVDTTLKTAKTKEVKKTTKVVAKATLPKMKTVKPVEEKKTLAMEVMLAKPKTPKKSVSMRVIDIRGKDAGSMQLPGEMFGVEVKSVLIAQAIRVYLANQRTGTSSTKTRGEVTGSTRKIYRQKGTGRARHGGIRAPLFVGGGIVFGPKPRDHSLKLTKKMRKNALFSALSAKRLENAITILSGTEKLMPKTKEAAKLFATLLLSDKNVLLVTVSEADNVKKAARNLPFVTLLPFTQLNTYDITKANAVVFLREAATRLAGHFLKGDN